LNRAQRHRGSIYNGPVSRSPFFRNLAFCVPAFRDPAFRYLALRDAALHDAVFATLRCPAPQSRALPRAGVPGRQISALRALPPRAFHHAPAPKQAKGRTRDASPARPCRLACAA